MPKRNTEFNAIPGLAERIKNFRTNKDYSLRGIAKELGMSQSGYANYELGKAEPSLSTLIKMSELFGVSIDDLLGTSAVRKPVSNQRQQALNNLWDIIEKYNNRDGYHALIEKDIVDNIISSLYFILNCNYVSKLRDTDKNLYSIQDAFNEINSIYDGKKKYTNPEGRLDRDIYSSYRNLKLLLELTKFFSETFKVKSYQFGSKDEFFKKLLSYKKEWRELEDRLEEMIFVNSNIKESE